jgi:methylenetetrahydrofolate--tRNA-(uracil-5-)-methyltransferase
MPIEVMAERGFDTLRFGPMKPVGLDDPRTGRWPYAVVQLRQDNAQGTLWNIVGFQTKLKHAEQVRCSAPFPGWRMPSSRGSAGCTATPSSSSPELLDGDAAAEGAPEHPLRRPDHRLRRLCRSAAIGLLAGRFAAAELAADARAAARRNRARRAARPHHRRRARPRPISR